MNLINFLIYAYLLLKPFYFFESGSVQVCDFFIIAAFILKSLSLVKKRTKNDFLKDNIFYVFFLFFVIIINLIWFFVTSDSRMILCTLFYIFNLFIIFMFSEKTSDLKFLKNMRFCLFSGLIIQLLLYIFKIGKYEYILSRYKGTLNDPNQFAFFCLTSFFLIYLINSKKEIKNDKIVIISFIISSFLIYMSASTGMLLSLAIFVGYYLVYKLFCLLKLKKDNRYVKVSTVVVSLLIFFFIILSLTGAINVSKVYNSILHSDIYGRVIGKITIGKTTNNGSGLLYDRGYDKIIKHPIYIIFGAGEGGFSRFTDCVNNEIHATIPSILFYYGIIPTFFLLFWILKKIKNIPKENYGLYLALFVESFTLLNQRQSFFWIIIIFGVLTLNSKKGEQL